MDLRPARMPVASNPGLASTVVKPEIPAAVAMRIAKAVQSSRSEGTRRTYAIADSVEVYRREHAPLKGNAVNEIGL